MSSGHSFGPEIFENCQVIRRSKSVRWIVGSRPIISDTVTTNLENQRFQTVILSLDKKFLLEEMWQSVFLSTDEADVL